MSDTEHLGDANADPGLQFGAVQVGLKPNQRYSGAQAQEAARVTIEAGESGQEYEFSITLGSATEADADAIAVPSNPGFGLGGGAVENVLAADMDKIAGAKPYSEDGPGNRFFEATAQQVRKERGGKGVPFGAASAFPSGPMAQRGIESVVLVNVLPDKGEQLTAEGVSLAVKNALVAAENAGATSMAISEIGTGFIAAMGGSPFKTRQEAWAPVFAGYTQYIEMAQAGQAKGAVSRLSLVAYAGANESNAQAVGGMLTSVVDDARALVGNGGANKVSEPETSTSPESMLFDRIAALAKRVGKDTSGSVGSEYVAEDLRSQVAGSPTVMVATGEIRVSLHDRNIGYDQSIIGLNRGDDGLYLSTRRDPATGRVVIDRVSWAKKVGWGQDTGEITNPVEIEAIKMYANAVLDDLENQQ